MRDPRLDAAQVLNANREAIACRVMERHYELDPAYARSLSSDQRAKCLQDVRYHLTYLASALATGSPGVFVSYTAWARDLLEPLGVRMADVERNMRILWEVVASQLPESSRMCLDDYIGPAISALSGLREPLPSEMPETDPLHPIAKRYLEALITAQRMIARDVIAQAVADSVPIPDLYLGVFAPVQREIGRLWQLGRITVAQEHYATAVTQLIIGGLYDKVFAGEREDKTIVVTCAGGELHELPARMVSDFFEMSGWNSHYLGASTPTPAVLSFIAEHRPHVLGISATMGFHLGAVADLIAAVRHSDAISSTKIIVGVYPFIRDRSLCEVMDADGCAPDGPGAVMLAETLIRA